MQSIRQTVLTRRKARGEDTEAGFTLIELLVVLLIIAILIAIAVPTFLSARTNAQNTAAMSDVRSGLTDIQSYYTANDSFKGMSATGLQTSSPSLKWTSSSPTAPAVANQVEVFVPVTNTSTNAGQSAYLTALSASGTCYELGQINATDSTAIQTGSTGITGTGTWYASFSTTASTSSTSTASICVGIPASSSKWSQTAW